MKTLVTVQQYGLIQMQVFTAIVVFATLIAAGKAARALPASQPATEEMRLQCRPQGAGEQDRATLLRREARARAELLCKSGD